MDFKARLLEYMPNGSPEQWSHSDDYFLNMTQRLDIMIDVAFALEYLHHGYATVVVHSDLKPSNVLLDERDGESIAHTNTLATVSYIAPDLAFQSFQQIKAAMMDAHISSSEFMAKTSKLGIIPREVGSLQKLERLYLQYNKLSSSKSDELFQYLYAKMDVTCFQ
ncbi:receptor kinase-like protein Xa21 [Lycium barbarum]|uniref:receptor kinase-like protein Xa21 n=1 Tax=Lycium barbarum TaxID=112863 RepID=UPI00293E6914|nr:receptor kinase-like protein Xa21 [Lycium barbarum]